VAGVRAGRGGSALVDDELVRCVPADAEPAGEAPVVGDEHDDDAVLRVVSQHVRDGGEQVGWTVNY
jgi:hypothetical protein